MKLLNCITINTDASFSGRYKIGTYAFYIVCDNFKIYKSGIFKENPQNPQEAEMMCMANALHILTTVKDLPSTKLIVINSDCLNAFEKISRKSKDKIGRVVAQKLRKVRELMAYKNSVYPEFEFRHVKAHTDNPNRRSRANDWCDTEAKRWMSIALKRIEHKSNKENERTEETRFKKAAA